uniref:CAP, isoform AD n=1 Tax=Drosophila melanogaster TaxID=7227 RepID=A0A6M3Q7N5_DROME|nr:CAP, isoform AD [Drosophila melanogaster]QJC18699.1 CAP, isoform AD [Drosophila melanogaster]
MDKVRELIEMTRREQEQGELPRSPSPPPVPPPPASVPPYSPESSSFHLASLQLKRQESNDSHCSDSTTHSQCTAINLASPPPPPTAQPPTPPLRQKPAPPPVPQPVSPPAPPTPQSEPELSVADSVANANADVDADADTDTEAIKKLRLLCTEQLASMPYGEQVLEELASVAQNISDQSQNKMPYPMPQLPHIKELQLNANESKSSSAWLGLPTQSDPKLLVCLSPGQRDLVNNQTQPDDLLDAHQKFVERRGYHELSKAQVLEQDHQQQQSEMLKTAAMMRELRKSLSPPAPPVPPPPVPVKSAETAAKATAHENAKRDDASEQKQKIAACESSSLENKPRRAADLGAQQSAEQRQSSSTTTSSHKATTETMSSDTAKFPTLDSMESELARMFPQHKGDIFEEQRKRFSNIEFPSHQPVSQTKRYSNIETSSYESKKRMENGQVVYDVSTSSHEKKEQGDPPKDQPVPPVPPPPIMSATKLNGNTFIDGDVAPKNSQPSRESGSGSGNGTYEEFRQRAKAAADAFGEQREQQNGLDQDRVFKDFDRLSQQMHAELQSTREKREKSASMYDLSGFTRPASGHPRLDELQQRRHAHMQELEREIERSAKSRQERMSSVPRQMEATPPRTHEIPIELEPRSRRAESLCNLNEPPPRPHTTVGHYNHPVVQDDWSRYANDLGYSENIARPFAREVEICYQRQNQRTPHCIRAPRLSASTNDLSSSSQYSYDTFNAYGGRRTHAPMLNQAQQQQRPHYGSCYSMIERDPNPRYISTTSRRGVSPAPPPVATPQQQQVPPPAYDRQQRRSSLPRELHEQQLKYILSKEEELKFEVERLQQERRRLMEEMQRAPVLPAPQRRESYRPAAKLPTLSEDEVFRQQMAEEWMNKVAEREERRQHKIIRISKIEDEHDHSAVDKATISDEFLDRVKERRHKLSMPADSDWESGAESQPQPAAQSQPESDVEAPPVRILEGQAEANLRQLPRHLREFAKFSTSEQLPDGAQMERHEEQERREEATDNAHSSATKKTSIVKTYKVSRLPPSVQGEFPGQFSGGNRGRLYRERSQTARLVSHNIPLELTSNHSSSPDSDFNPGCGSSPAPGSSTQSSIPSLVQSPTPAPPPPIEPLNPSSSTAGGILGTALLLGLSLLTAWNKFTRPSYKSNGYVSEPEPNYDSDYSTVRYRTQNPHRVQSVSSAVNVRNLNQDEKLYGTMPNPIKSAQNSYKNQPGRIENYTTGHSSVSEKEKKENLEQSKLSPLYTEGNLSRALAKESGYTSDSNLVFRKKEVPVSSPLSPVEQKQAYKSLQAGGEPPLLGFRKPAPEKPRDLDPNAPPIPPQPPVKGLSSYDFPYSTDTVDGSDVNIHFKTPIRHEQRQNLSEEELAIRQAEHMQKLYHEERRRKYLQELQDMNSRRHTDNFTPSQKSPIALNRYDDFPTDVTLKSLVGPKTVARALFNFQGQTSKELSFRKGDTIYIRRQIDANWYEGEHNAMIGLLPASYVEIVSRDGARTPSKRPSEGQARAKYNFQAQSGIELSLNKGELVTLTRRVDGNWFEGKIANRKGIFPCSYVEVLTDIGAEDIAARTTTVITSQSTTNLRPNLDVLRTNINNEFNTLTQNGAQPPNGILKETRTLHKTDALHVDTSSEPLAYRALYKYRPQNSDELELLEGDVVHVLEKCDDGWFVGTSQRTGCFGTFPGNYVERA